MRAIKVLVWILALLPFARLLYLGATAQFGANPLEFVTRSTGTWTLVMLCVTLAITPLRRFTGWNWLIKLRRMLGLFAFFYAVQHFLLWLGVDRGFDVAYMIKDIAERPFITVGFAAFVLLVPLAATSTNGMRQAPGRQAVAGAAQGGLCDRGARHPAFLVAQGGQERLQRSVDLRRRGVRAAGPADVVVGAQARRVAKTARPAGGRGAPRDQPLSRCSPLNRSAGSSRSRTRCTVSPSTITSAARPRVL